jgi:hypothetical protein
MARGMKISRYNNSEYKNASIQVDQAMGPEVVTYVSNYSTVTTFTTYASGYVGGTGGNPTSTTPLTIAVNYKDVNGNAYSDGFIVTQRGRKQFMVQSISGGATTLTLATLAPVSAGSLTAGQMSITGVGPTGNLFYAGRITNNFVWTGVNGNGSRYRYVLGTASAVSYSAANAGTNFYVATSSATIPAIGSTNTTTNVSLLTAAPIQYAIVTGQA